MGSQSRNVGHEEETVAQPGGAPSSASARGRPTGWRKWLYRAIAGLVIPGTVLLSLELCLWAFGYGYPTSFFLPARLPRGEAIFRENLEFGRRFFPPGLLRNGVPIVLPASKSKDVYRVFVIGESAAMGFPHPAYGFASILEVMLQHRYPKTRFEVINTATVAINSHVALFIACECAEHDPDLFVVHVGNNEVVGPFGVAGVLGSHVPALTLVRTNLAVRTTRTGQLFDSMVQRVRPAESPAVWEGMATFGKSHVRADDPRLDTMLTSFQRNLEDIGRAARGVPVLMCTVPVNLRDSAPFASEHASDLTPAQLARWEQTYEAGVAAEKARRWAEALTHYEKSAEIDATFADVAYRQARCLEKLGQADAAKLHYEQARDLDALRFRSDARINAAIRSVAEHLASSGVHAVDAERDFAAASSGGVPGEDLFLEHVHMNFKGNYLLALAVFRGIARLQSPPGPPGAAEGGDADGGVELTEAECAERLAYGTWGAYYADCVIRDMFRDEPFRNQLDHVEREQRWDIRIQGLEARFTPDSNPSMFAAYERALDAAPHNWTLREAFADLLTARNEVPRALTEYERVVDQVPHHFSVLRKLGNLYLRHGQVDHARNRIETALKIHPGLLFARYDLADVGLAEGKYEEAVAALADAVKHDPDRAEGLARFADFYLSRDHLAEARARADEAFAINPNCPLAHMAMGRLCLREGAIDEAHKHFEAAVRARPRLEPEVAKIDPLRRQAKPAP
jgi:tetratricopeptide (TPR) repeat protein